MSIPTRLRHRKVLLRVEEMEDRCVPALLGNQLFPADNAWNQRITNAPVASNSTAIINSIVGTYGNGRLHPDFGQDDRAPGADLYGIPYNVVHGNSTPKISVVIDAYPSESDIVPAPIPANLVLEGDFQNGPRVGVNNRGDSHLIVYDVDNNIVYEYYRASRPSENGDNKWHADQQSVWDLKTNTFRTIGWTSADAAGLSVLAGLVRPDEGLPVSQGGQGVINHAIRFTLQNAVILNQFVYPASHTANPGNNNTAIQPPMGTRFRLKAGVDITQLNPQSRVIAQAMKDYGMIVADNGSNFFFSGASYAVDASSQFTLTWDDDDIQDTVSGLKSLRFGDFEVVDLTPIVTGLSTPSGPAGTSVTVTGQNFSGAAGRLQVFFGSTPATSVTVVNDGQLNVVAPAGSGTVDVRVQSGLTTGANARNIKSPIFGYGISTITPADRFTYSTTSNQAPTVASPAAAAPNPVTGTTTTLSVLGADNGGEASLSYTWTSSGPATVAFSANGSNAAKSTTATFGSPGSYTLTATITDTGGLSVTSSTSVTVTAPAAPARIIATGADAGGSPHVKVFGIVNGHAVEKLSFFAYTPVYRGGVRVAVGDINNDGSPDIVTATGAGGGPHVRVFDSRTGAPLNHPLASFFAYAPGFSLGMYLAVGDVNGDGFADIITGAERGAGPHVKVFSGQNGSELHSFFAYIPSFTGGVRVAAGDVTGDGRAEILCAAGPGGGPHVQVLDGINRTVLRSFYAYAPQYSNGTFIAAGDVDGDGKADIITGAGPSGGPHVQAFSGATGLSIRSFFAEAATLTTGIRVGVTDVNGDGRADIVTGIGPGGPGRVRAFNGLTMQELDSFFAYDPATLGGIFVSGI